MKHSLRKLSVLVVLGAMVALLGSQSAFFGGSAADAAAVSLAEDNIEWSDTSGNAITSIKPGVTGHFFIKDGALETTKSGTAAFSGMANNSTFFNIASGAAGTNSSTATTTSVTRVLTASGYDSTTPANTPLTAYPTAATGANATGVFVSSANLTAGSFSTISGVSASTTATFSYHIADSWSGSDSTLRKAKVTSTSDPAGEWITIGEVTSLSATTSNATSQVFYGTVALSSNAAHQGTNSDGVWVQDGDTVTASYYANGTTLTDSTTLTVDGVKPTISGVTPADGTITNVANPTVQFDVTDSGSGISTSSFNTDITLAINGTSVASGLISFQSISDGFRAIFAQGTAWTAATNASGFAVTDSTEFYLTITATDQAGNTQTVTTTAANVTIDKTAPTITSSATGAANTLITVTFSEDIDSASVAAGDFSLSAGSVTAAEVNTATDKGNEVLLTTSALAADAKPTVTVSTVSDKAGNAITAASTSVPTDGVKATLSALTIDKSLAIKADAVKTSVTTDEKLATNGMIMSVVGPSGATTNGTLTITSPTPNNSEGTFTVATGDTTGAYGVSIQATDLGSNATTNLTAVADEVAGFVASTNTVTLANGPIGDVDFDGDVDSSDITVKVGTTSANATTTGVTLGAIDASARTIVVSSGLTSSSVALVSYSHTSDSFEIDVSAPAVTFDPADGTTVKNQSPYIRLVFDEDEYPGDSYKTVTLTKASLLYPDGTTADVLANFTTGDNIEYIWGATDLALGDYELTVSATDTATNALTDSVGKFTIAKRSVTLSLRPGWNLVSLPDDPASTANGVNDVFSSDKIDVVLTYDPTSAAGWLSATRAAGAATLESTTLTSVDGARAYWVHSTDVVSLSVDLPGLAPGSATLPPAYDLSAGWNLVPYATADLSVTSRDADDYFTGLKWSRAYSFNNTTNSFVGALPLDSSTVDVGSGYWVYLREAGTLVP